MSRSYVISAPPDLVRRFQRGDRRVRAVLIRESEDLKQFATSTSPAESGLFRRSWRKRTLEDGFIVHNLTSYAQHVRRSGSETTILEEVVEELRSRSGRIAALIQAAITDTLGGP